MSPDVYKLVHVAGIFMVFMSLGGLALHGLNGGTKESNRSRRWTTITYGIGLFLILLGGFGYPGSRRHDEWRDAGLDLGQARHLGWPSGPCWPFPR